MFIQLTQGSYPLFVNVNHIGAFEPIMGETYNTILYVQGDHILVSETVDEIKMIIDTVLGAVQRKENA